MAASPSGVAQRWSSPSCAATWQSSSCDCSAPHRSPPATASRASADAPADALFGIPLSTLSALGACPPPLVPELFSVLESHVHSMHELKRHRSTDAFWALADPAAEVDDECPLDDGLDGQALW